MKSGPETLIDRYRAALDSLGVDNEVMSRDGVSDNGLIFQADPSCGPAPALIESWGLMPVDQDGTPAPDEVSSDGVLTQAVFYPPYPVVTEAAEPAVAELLMYLAPEMAIGSFELDPEEPKVRFRISTVHPNDGSVPESLLVGPLVEAVEAMDQWFEAFDAVLGHGAAPGHAFLSARLSNAEPEDLAEVSDGERHAWGRMLRRAATYYADRGDDRLAELESLGAALAQS